MHKLSVSMLALILAVGAFAAIACTSSADGGDAAVSATNSESAVQEDLFLDLAEARSLQAVGVDPVGADSASAEFSADRGMSGETSTETLPQSVTTISTSELGQEEYPLDTQIARSLTAQEQLLTGIWTRSINAVVLISTDSGSGPNYFVFPGNSEGAGFFWDDSGHVVTNAHVIQSNTTGYDFAQDITVTTHSGIEYSAVLVGADEFADLAVLKIEDPVEDDSHTLVLGDSSVLIPGMTAVALGHPFGTGQDFSMTHGIVSGLDREIQTTADPGLRVPGVVQTDADVNPGNSGGPLLNSSGQVIGVNTQIRSRDNTNSGVGFALPINLVKKVVDGIITHGAALHSYMGISMAPLNQRILDATGVSGDQPGVYITHVFEDTPAREAGLLGDTGYGGTGFRATSIQGDGDVILSINGMPVEEIADLRQFLTFRSSPGEVVTMRVLRGGALVDIPITLGSKANYE